MSQNLDQPKYRGRFAPSPTGPLHFGSLVAATGSYLQARTQNGEWYIRIEDIDIPRNVAGADNDILRTLELLGFEWDSEVSWQTRHLDDFEESLDILKEEGHCFSCSCSRSRLMETAIHGRDGFIYPGTCRGKGITDTPDTSIRVRVDDRAIAFSDAIQGSFSNNIARDIGDFVIKRADGLFAYQLAVVVDDAKQGITEVVRGTDLLGSTSRQIYLQQLLHLITPEYMHLPVAVNRQGQKLSKQTGASAINHEQPGTELFRALTFLGQSPPAELVLAEPAEIWQWAFENWDIKRIPHVTSQPTDIDFNAKTS
jgi:glutamyl-Q tRNA(Asp) synthetase